MVATDGENDVAVLKVEASRDFPTVILGDSDEAQEGTPIAVTGYPQPSFTTHLLGSGIQSCTSRGIVSARRTGGLHGAGIGRPFLQYDATTLQGNSGGPIYRLDTQEVVAIVCLGRPNGETFNFGVPINEAKLLLQKAGVTLQPNPVAPQAPEAAVDSGDISLLSTIGPDKSLTSLLATNYPLAVCRTEEQDQYDQLLTNAGHFSCYGQMAPQISPPVLVKGRLVMTQGTGQVVVYDPRYVGSSNDLEARSLFNVESGYLFYPPAGDDRQIVFSSGTPTFKAKEEVDAGLAVLSFLAAVGGSPGIPVTRSSPPWTRSEASSPSIPTAAAPIGNTKPDIPALPSWPVTASTSEGWVYTALWTRAPVRKCGSRRKSWGAPAPTGT